MSTGPLIPRNETEPAREPNDSSPLVYRNYTQRELDDQYDTSVPLGGSPEPYFERFRAASAQARAALPFETLHYGDGERETVDVVAAADDGAPLFFFVHGGYWRRMSKDDFSFVAVPAAQHGAAVAIVNYPLAPQATLDEIVAAVLRAYAFVSARAPSLRFDPRRAVAGGHSVGAQLAAMVAAAIPLQGLLGLSGLYDLEPIRRSSINATIGMDAPSAHRYSPIHRPPLIACPLVLACGEREQSEFHRQQRDYAAAWRGWGGSAPKLLPAPGHDHFSLVLELGRPETTIAQALTELLDRALSRPAPWIDPARDPVHVVGRMLQRRISWTDILAVVTNPTQTASGHSRRTNYFGYAPGRRRIRVTLEADGAVVTVALAQTRQE